MGKMYYTVCAFDVDANEWFDEFGSYDVSEAMEEMRELRDGGKDFVRVVRHEDTAKAMMAARDALPKPFFPGVRKFFLRTMELGEGKYAELDVVRLTRAEAAKLVKLGALAEFNESAGPGCPAFVVVTL